MNLNQVTFHVADVARAAEFYRRLGLRLIVDALPRYVRFECPDGGSTFSLEQSDEPAPAAVGGRGAVIYFECDDLDGTVERLAREGVAFESAAADQPWLWREARLRDPEGNRICLYRAGRNRRFPPWRVG